MSAVPGAPLPAAFFARSVHEVAPQLIGVTLLVAGVGGPIVEVEAYDRSDPASHAFPGPTARNRAMFGPPGRAYVYRSYGIHWCLNLVCGIPDPAAGAGAGGPGEAVLVRALEPTHGLAEMEARRGLANPRLLAAGPGRLAQALGVTAALDGAPLDAPPFELLALAPGAPRPAVATAPRIGITKAAHLPWRYAAEGSPYLSRPVPRAPRGLSPRPPRA